MRTLSDIFARKRSDRSEKWLIGSLLAVISLVAYQNCSIGPLGQKLRFEKIPAAAELSSGNGEGYDGKPDPGQYDRLVMGHRCGDLLARLTVEQNGSVSFFTSLAGQVGACAAEERALSSADLEFAGYNPTLIAYRDGVFERQPEPAKAISYLRPESWCRLPRGENEGIDFVLRFEERSDRPEGVGVSEIHIGRRDSAGNHLRSSVPVFAVDRQMESGSIQYSSRFVDFKLGVDFSREIAGQPGRFMGRVLATIDGERIDQNIECRTALNFDVEAYHLEFGGVQRIYPTDEPMMALIPVTASRFDSFSITPPLPAGLSIQPSSGVISGQPRVFTDLTSYTVTAVYASGVRQAQLQFATGARFVVNEKSANAGDANLRDQICADDHGRCTLRAALEEAAASFSDLRTLVIVPGGDYLVGGSEMEIRSSVDIVGDGPGVTRLDAQALSRIFNATERVDLLIKGLSLVNGSSVATGGGCLSVGENSSASGNSTLILQQVDVVGCRTPETVTVPESSQAGGGVSFKGASLIVRESRFINNQLFFGVMSPLGGGLAVKIENGSSLGKVEILNSHFSGNRASYGGGAAITGAARVLIRNVEFLSNSAGIYGGGLFIESHAAQSKIEQSLFVRNMSVGGGGGLMTFGSEGVELVSSTFTENLADRGAAVLVSGAYYLDSATVLRNTTVSGNQVLGDGEAKRVGGLYILGTSARVRFQNSIVANNGGTNCFGEADSLQSLGSNLESQNSCGLSTATDRSMTDPGLIKTANGFMPGVTSPARDAGDNGACPLFDQEGRLRLIGGTGGSRCDIGATEFLDVPTFW